MHSSGLRVWYFPSNTRLMRIRAACSLRLELSLHSMILSLRFWHHWNQKSNQMIFWCTWNLGMGDWKITDTVLFYRNAEVTLWWLEYPQLAELPSLYDRLDKCSHSYKPISFVRCFYEDPHPPILLVDFITRSSSDNRIWSWLGFL